MAFAGMIPEVWSARWLANLDKAYVFGRAINRTFQADADVGDLIKVDKMGSVAITDYVKNTDHAVAETLTPTQTEIAIDQAKMFNFQIDNIEEAQTIPNLMDSAMQRAAYAMAGVVDLAIFAEHANATSKTGTVAVPVTPVITDIYAYLTNNAKLLDKLNVPTYGRFAIMGPAAIKLLKDSGEMLSDTPVGDIVRLQGQFGDPGVLPDGYKGRMAGFDLWMSNNTAIDATTTETMMFGHNMAIALVDSVNKFVAYVPELRFGDAMKGLYVYGIKTVQPDALAVVYTDLT